MDISQIHNVKSGQFTTFDVPRNHKTKTVAPGQTIVLAEGDGPGVITRFWCTITGWFYEHWNPQGTVDTSIFKKLVLRIYWDGNEYPSVQAPIGDFFGIGHCEYVQYLSKYQGFSSGGFFSLWPMPYQKVKITLENLHESMTGEIFLNVNYNLLEALPTDAGRFHCQFQTGRKNGSEPMQVLDTKGKGHFAGCCLSMQGSRKSYLSFLEAPEYFYFDGEKEPGIVGTGLEDYIGGGWYFREGEFCGDLHGVPLKDPLRSMVSMYRFHEADAIHFEKGLRLEFVNPWKPDALLPYWYSSTAYYYLDAPCAAAPPTYTADEMMGMYVIRDTEHIAVP